LDEARSLAAALSQVLLRTLLTACNFSDYDESITEKGGGPVKNYEYW